MNTRKLIDCADRIREITEKLPSWNDYEELQNQIEEEERMLGKYTAVLSAYFDIERRYYDGQHKKTT